MLCNEGGGGVLLVGSILVTILLLCLQSVTPNYAKLNAPHVCWDSKRRASMCLGNAVQFTPVVSEASGVREGWGGAGCEQGAREHALSLGFFVMAMVVYPPALSICSAVYARLRLWIASDGFSYSFFQVPKGVCVHQNAEYQVSSELGGDREGG